MRRVQLWAARVEVLVHVPEAVVAAIILQYEEDVWFGRWIRGFTCTEAEVRYEKQGAHIFSV